MTDVYTLLAALPFVVAHPFILVFVVPAFFWVAAHAWTFVKAPSATSNATWKLVYKVINTVIAANYGKSANFNAKADAVLTLAETMATVQPSANSTPIKG